LPDRQALLSQGWTTARTAFLLLFRRPFLERQLVLCFEAIDACSKLATETDMNEWEKARLTFWRLYWGPLCVVEDRAVADAMYDVGKFVPKPGKKPSSLPMTEIERPSIALAHVARALVLKSWDVKLQALTELKRDSDSGNVKTSGESTMAARA
jgi:hypothetical protein